jgi:hypothetical protein
MPPHFLEFPVDKEISRPIPRICQDIRELCFKCFLWQPKEKSNESHLLQPFHLSHSSHLPKPHRPMHTKDNTMQNVSHTTGSSTPLVTPDFNRHALDAWISEMSFGTSPLPSPGELALSVCRIESFDVLWIFEAILQTP